MGCSRGRLNRSFVAGTCLHLPSYASIISRLLISLRAPVRGSAGQPVRRPPSPPVHRSACPSMSVAGPHPPRAGLPRCLGCPPGGRGSPTSAEPRRTDRFAPPGSLGPSARRERRVGGRGHPARPHFGDPARDLQKSSQPPDSRAPQHPPISADRGPAAVGATPRHFSQCDLDAS